MKFIRTAILRTATVTTLAAACASVGLLHAQTTSIPVPNFSFEDPAVAGDYYQENFSNSTFVPGFTFDDRNSNDVSGTVDQRFAGQAGADGARDAFLNIGDSSFDSITTTNAVTMINAGTDYVATIAVGNDAGTGDYLDPGTVYLNLLVNGNVVSQTMVEQSQIADGTIHDFSVALTAAEAMPFVGQGLSIQFGGADPGAGGQTQRFQPVFDNVRLTATTTAAPEPSTWVLLVVGLISVFLIFPNSSVCKLQDSGIFHK